MPDFEKKRMGDYASITVGGTPSTAIPSYWGGEIPWMASGDVHKKRIKDVDGRITQKGLQFSNATMVSPPAVAVALAGQGKTRGTAALTEIEICTNQSVALIKTRESSISSTYLFHLLTHEYEDLRAASAGGGRAGLSKTILENYEIGFPVIHEQKAIATVLDTVDEAIQSTQAMLDKQDKIKQGLLHDLLTRGVDERGHLRPSPETAPDLYQKTEIGLIPKGWNLKPLENVATLQRGFDLPIQDRADGDVPVYGSNGVDGWHNQSPLSGPGVITGRSGSIGFVFYSEGPYWPLNTTLYVKNFNGNSPKFVRLILQSMDLKKYVASTGVPSLNRNFVHPVLVAIAERKEQERIIQRVESIDEVHFSAMTDLEKLRNLKSGLMQDLLTGRKRVTPSLMRDVEKLAEAA